MARTTDGGLCSIESERGFVVTDAYDEGAEFVTEVRDWAGTRVDKDLADRVHAVRARVRLHQEVRLRVL